MGVFNAQPTKSSSLAIATWLNQLTPQARGHSSANSVQTAPRGVIWGLRWCLSHSLSHCWTSLHTSHGLTPRLKSMMTANLKQSKVNSDTDGQSYAQTHTAEKANQTHRIGQRWRIHLWSRSRHLLPFYKPKQQRKKRTLCCVTHFSADICLIDDFVPHQSIMHNLTWIKSHINIITHWIFCIVWHASEEQNPSLRKSDRGDAWVGKHTHFPSNTNKHTRTHTNTQARDVTDVKMSDPYSV